MAVVYNIGWYATGFRGDAFEEALQEIAPIALRYGATDWAVYRAIDDRYKFQQMAMFESKADGDIYWNGPEFTAWRTRYSSWFQVPVVPAPLRRVASGRVGLEDNGNGGTAVSPARAAPSSAPRR
jgi:hypothetical protein